MLGLAKRVKARILLASTSEIYGDPEVHPQPEVSLFSIHIFIIAVHNELT
jgi:GDP-D-mannose dehydratase